MSNEKRPYTKRARAETEAETRARIAQAAVDLHGSVGPARTTISAVAERAGVRRATVYRHFPDEAALFAACSGRWLAQNPLPDVSGLAGIENGVSRLGAALELIYPYYRANARMLGNVLRDVDTVPALRETLTGLNAWTRSLRDLLLQGLAADPDDAVLAAAVGHAISFAAWQSLCLVHGLSDDAARDLMRGMIVAER